MSRRARRTARRMQPHGHADAFQACSFPLPGCPPVVTPPDGGRRVLSSQATLNLREPAQDTTFLLSKAARTYRPLGRDTRADRLGGLRRSGGYDEFVNQFTPELDPNEPPELPRDFR